MFSSALALIALQRLWQGLAGFVTVLFVAHFLSPEAQGWYYTFISIAALYSVFDMGLSAVLVQTAAHVFRGLVWRIGGAACGPSAPIFESFLGQAFWAYLKLAGIFSVLVLTAGLAYFSGMASREPAAALWWLPWSWLVIVTAASMVFLPLAAIVEGTGELKEVYRLRLLQGVAGSALCWLFLANGWALWATSAAPTVACLAGSWWLLSGRRETLLTAIRPPDRNAFDWRREMWPLQWRTGLSWVGTYMMSQLATPILFYFQGPVVAGQMGLSLTIAHMVGLIAQSALAWVTPSMSRSVSEQNWPELQARFRRGITLFGLIFLCGLAAVLVGMELIANSPYAQRVLAFPGFVGLMVFVLFYQLNAALASHLRAFRRDPLAPVMAVGGMLVVLGSVIAAWRFDSFAVVAVMVGLQALLVFPWSFTIWRRSAAIWKNTGFVAPR